MGLNSLHTLSTWSITRACSSDTSKFIFERLVNSSCSNMSSSLPAFLADPLSYVLHHFGKRTSGTEQACYPKFHQLRFVLFGDYPAPNDNDVSSPPLLEQTLDLGKCGHVSAIEERKRHNVDVLVYGHLRHLFRGWQEPAVYDLHSGI